MYEKKFFRVPDYEWAPRAALEYGYPGDMWYHAIRHEITGRRAWKSQIEADAIEERDHGVRCRPRPRTTAKLPDSWCDVRISRGFWVKSWKDKTKKKRQWYR